MADGVAGGSEATASFQDFAGRLAAGRGDAAEELLARYSGRLAALARCRLNSKLATKMDPEDVVQSVFRTFFRRLGRGEFELTDWTSLSGLLSLLTLRRCHEAARFYATAGRDAAREVPLLDEDGRGPAIPDREATAEEVATFAELLAGVLDSLGPGDRDVLERLIAGESVAEVAERIGRVERTVYRKLDRIRDRLISESD